MHVSVAHELLLSEHTSWFGLMNICHVYSSMVQLAEVEKSNHNPKTRN